MTSFCFRCSCQTASFIIAKGVFCDRSPVNLYGTTGLACGFRYTTNPTVLKQSGLIFIFFLSVCRLRQCRGCCRLRPGLRRIRRKSGIRCQSRRTGRKNGNCCQSRRCESLRRSRRSGDCFCCFRRIRRYAGGLR